MEFQDAQGRRVVSERENGKSNLLLWLLAGGGVLSGGTGIVLDHTQESDLASTVATMAERAEQREKQNDLRFAELASDILDLYDNENDERIQNARIDRLKDWVNTLRVEHQMELVTWP
jgi:hypothetical protein